MSAQNDNSTDPRFAHGARWVRGDFHLHTRADKKFKFTGDPSHFASAWLDRLTAEGVEIGMVTNHNHFDREEFSELSKAGRKRGIFIMPGVELSVCDGANGVHALVVFDSNAWLADGRDEINCFLNAAFYGTNVQNRSNENERCGWNFEKLLQELHDQREKHQRDSFIVLAHVEQASGFFNAFDGGRIAQIGKNPLFWENVLAFQKVRTADDVAKWEQWLGPRLPAFVEGSDPDELAKVGKAHLERGAEQRCYLHVGAFTFAAVKLALLNSEARVAPAPLEIEYPHVISISVEGGGADGVKFKWNLNPALNNLIGIRGSGKSTVLELLRYGLGMDLSSPWTTKPEDEGYKTGLVRDHLGSGGEVRIRLLASGTEYEVRRIFGERPVVFADGQRKENLRPHGGLLRVLYFGQKDLSALGNASRNTDLLEKFYGEELRETRGETTQCADRVRDLVQRLSKQTDTLEKRQQYLEQKAKLVEQLRVFEEHKVAEKLNRQVAFNTDLTNLSEMAEWLGLIAREAGEAAPVHDGDLQVWQRVTSEENPQELAAAKQALDAVAAYVDDLKRHQSALITEQQKILAIRKALEEKRRGLDEEFAAVRRAIQDVAMDADAYVNLKRKLRATELALQEIEKEHKRRSDTSTALNRALHALREAWRAEFRLLEAKVAALNERKLPIQLGLEYRGNKAKFTEFLAGLVRGTGINAATLEKLTGQFVDPIDFYEDTQQSDPRWKKVVTVATSQTKFEERVKQSFDDFLTFRVPDLLTLKIRGTPMEKHSLGQRTSALVLFLLEKGDYDILLIDQPEDDLDNQTLYTDVIKRLRGLKSQHQFVFATHNPNIPVLGEAEMVAACAYEERSLRIVQGSTDAPAIQQEIISVMEGGQEAFERRRSIYEQWTH